MPEHSEAGRFLCSELVEVCLFAACGEAWQVVGNLEEISPEAAVLLLDVPARKHSRLSFTAGHRRFSAVVESCAYEPPLGYMVSIRFAGGYRWSLKDFAPAHFLRAREKPSLARAVSN